MDDDAGVSSSAANFFPSDAAKPPRDSDSAKMHDPISHLYETSFEDVRQLVSCKVCVRPMYEPYTIACGHTFCYSCLTQWFENNRRNKTCPECRAPVLRQPAPSYVVSEPPALAVCPHTYSVLQVRELSRILSSRPELLPPDETTAEHEEIRLSEARAVEQDKSREHRASSGGLFRGCFNFESQLGDMPRVGLMDHSDGVMRCPMCHWELENGYCYQCSEHIPSAITRFSSDDESEDEGHSPDEAGLPPFFIAARRDARIRQHNRMLGARRGSISDVSSDSLGSELSSGTEPDSLDEDTDLDGFIDDGDGEEPVEPSSAYEFDAEAPTALLPSTSTSVRRVRFRADTPYRDEPSQDEAGYVSDEHDMWPDSPHSASDLPSSDEEDGSPQVNVCDFLPDEPSSPVPSIGDEPLVDLQVSFSSDETAEEDESAKEDGNQTELVVPRTQPSRKRRRVVVEDSSDDDGFEPAPDHSLLPTRERRTTGSRNRACLGRAGFRARFAETT